MKVNRNKKDEIFYFFTVIANPAKRSLPNSLVFIFIFCNLFPFGILVTLQMSHSTPISLVSILSLQVLQGSLLSTI